MESKTKAALIVNLLLVVFGAMGLYLSLEMGMKLFIYFTELTAIVSLVAACLMSVFLITKKSIAEVPFWVLMMKYIASAMSGLTFLVVVLILGPVFRTLPMMDLLFKGSMLYNHTLCPLLTIFGFIFFEGDRRLNRKKTIWGPVLAVALYGVVMIALNYAGSVDGPYPFLRVLYQPVYMTVIWFVGLCAFMYLIARVILLNNQKRAPRIRKRA